MLINFISYGESKAYNQAVLSGSRILVTMIQLATNVRISVLIEKSALKEVLLITTHHHMLAYALPSGFANYIFYHCSTDGIASRILKKLILSGGLIILTISNPQELSNLVNSFSVLNLPPCVSASINISVNFPKKGAFPSGMIVSIISNLGMVCCVLGLSKFVRPVFFIACKQFFKIIAADSSSQFRITFFIILQSAPEGIALKKSPFINLSVKVGNDHNSYSVWCPISSTFFWHVVSPLVDRIICQVDLYFASRSLTETIHVLHQYPEWF